MKHSSSLASFKNRLRHSLSVLLLVGGASWANATDYTWDYTGSSTLSESWFTAANWSPTGDPGQVSGQTDNILGFDVSNTANLKAASAYNIGTFDVTPLGAEATATNPSWVIESVTSSNTLNITTLNDNATQVAGTSFTVRDSAATAGVVTALNIGQVNVYGASTSTVLNFGISNNATTTGVLSSLNITSGIAFLGSGISTTNLNVITGNTENLGLISTNSSFTGTATLNLNDNTGNGSVNNNNTITTSGLSSDPGATGTVTIAGSSITAGVAGALVTIQQDSTLAITNNSDESSNFVLIDDSSNGTTAVLTLTKAGTGTQTLTGASTYSGGTTITAGTLLANNALGSATGVGAVSVAVGGKLGGIGTVGTSNVTTGVAVDVSGALSPGNGNEGTSAGIGTLTFALNSGTGSSVNLESGSAFAFDLATTQASDLIKLTGGTLGLNGQQITDFTFNLLSGFGDGTYTLFDTAGVNDITGSLGSTVTETLGSYTATLETGTDASGDEDLNLVVTGGTAAPEPGTFWLVAGSMGFLFLAYRRNKAVQWGRLG